jgi:molybdopterin-guanine dinucleotide biosynthesis protein A
MSHRAQNRAGFVLAGGKSTRMGRDKAFLEFEGQTLLDRALTVVTRACDHVKIVGDPARFAKYESQTILADTFPGCGPLAGIHAALTHSSSDLNLMLAVDMPFVSSELLSFLLTKAEDNAAVVNVPRIKDGLQPLCAIYRRDFTSIAERALRAGKYKIDALFPAVSTHVIEETVLQAAGFSARSFFNMNTPHDFADQR